MTILDTIIASTRAEVEQRKRAALDATGSFGESGPGAAGEGAAGGQIPAATADLRAAGRLRAALSAPGMSVIAEIKRRSPSAGELRAEVDVAEIAKAYERGGASALSVLTEGPHFGGSLADLRAARAACDLPILRKDFIVDSFQLQEAAAAGADAVLLIVAALSADEIETLRLQAAELGLDALVEVHDGQELEIALGAGAEIVGVNNRDLRDFSVDVERTFALLEQMPAGVTVVSESGIGSAEQLRRLAEAGVAAVLVGESLMRADDPAVALASLRSPKF